MMWYEFMELAGYEVSYEDYHNIIEPMYLAVPETVSKMEFINMLDKKRFAVKHEKKPLIKTMSIRDNSGYRKTPNGCYYHLVDVEIMDINIRTGKIKVKVIEDSYRLGYDYDFTDDDIRITIQS